MNTNFLNESVIEKICPAAFGLQKHDRLKNSYEIVPTIDVARALKSEGWEVTQAVQVRGKNDMRNLTNRHLLRFRHVDSKPILNGTHPEILIMNSNNGATSFFMNAGLYRMVCSNGMVVDEATFETRKYSHKQGSIGEIIEGTYEVLSSVEEIADQSKRYNGMLINQAKREEFALRCLSVVRPGDDLNEVDINSFVKPRRSDDSRPSLWNTFNIIQENVIAGNAQLVRNNGKNTKFRGITAPRKNVSVNQGLWSEMKNFYDEIKAA